MRPGIMDFPDIDRATLEYLESKWSPNERALARAGFDPFVTPRHMDAFNDRDWPLAADNVLIAMRAYGRASGGWPWLNLGEIRDLTLHSEQALYEALTWLAADGPFPLINVRTVEERNSDGAHSETRWYQYAGAL